MLYVALYMQHSTGNMSGLDTCPLASYPGLRICVGGTRLHAHMMYIVLVCHFVSVVTDAKKRKVVETPKSSPKNEVPMETNEKKVKIERKRVRVLLLCVTGVYIESSADNHLICTHAGTQHRQGSY